MTESIALGLAFGFFTWLLPFGVWWIMQVIRQSVL